MVQRLSIIRFSFAAKLTNSHFTSVRQFNVAEGVNKLVSWDRDIELLDLGPCPFFVFGKPQNVIVYRVEGFALLAAFLLQQDCDDEILVPKYFTENLSNPLNVVVINLHEYAAIGGQQFTSDKETIPQVGQVRVQS